jgi:hypothetical protein
VSPPDDPEASSAAEEETWFSAGHLAEASAVEVGSSAWLLEPYGVAQLRRDSARRLLGLERLPGWPGAGPCGSGWGPELHAAVGGLELGARILVGAGGAGHGRSAFVLQLADGLGLRCATAADVLTPVVVLAEDGVDEAGRRTLARFSGRPARVFRDGREGAAQWVGGDLAAVDGALAAAVELLEGELSATRRFVRFVAPALRGPDLVAALVDRIAGWRAELSTGPGAGPEVWPVVVVDGLGWWAGGERGAADLFEALGTAARRVGFVLLASERDLSDRLDPLLDVRLELARTDEDPAELVVRVARQRGGPTGGVARYRFDPATGRVDPRG